MPNPIKIIIGQTILEDELFDSPCAQAIRACLPIETQPQVWGDEFYRIQGDLQLLKKEKGAAKIRIEPS